MDARDLATLVGATRRDWYQNNGNGTATVTFEEWYFEDDDQPDLRALLGESGRVTIRTRNEVCPLCDGNGKYVNPSIDHHGLTADDFDDDPDFAESYFSGVYDVLCEQCGGNNVVAVPDPHTVNPMIITAIEERMLEEERIAYEDYRERRSEALMMGGSLNDW